MCSDVIHEREIGGGVVRERRMPGDQVLLVVATPRGTYEIRREGETILDVKYDTGATLSEAIKAAHERRVAVASPTRDHWAEADHWLRALRDPRKVVSFLRAVGSRLWEGPVNESVLNFRHSCCHGETIDGVKVSAPCPSRVLDEGSHYCKSCGCGKHRLAPVDVPREGGARLFTKLAYPLLRCPRGRFTEMRGQR